MEKPINDRFVGHRAAAAALKISSGTLYGKVSRGEISVYKVKGGHKNLYKLSEIEELLKPVKQQR